MEQEVNAEAGVWFMNAAAHPIPPHPPESEVLIFPLPLLQGQQSPIVISVLV